MKPTLEVCVDTVDGVQACVQGGADRIELCSALAQGGLTPSAGLMDFASRCHLPVYAMIRPRGGDFCYSEQELNCMRHDIDMARSLNLAGVVLGASTEQATLNIGQLRTLIKASGPLGLTLHRVIDTLSDPVQAVEEAIDLGFERILTSGGAVSVEGGISTLLAMHNQAQDRIEIMAGSGLNPAIALQIMQQTGIRSFHASCSQPVAACQSLLDFGFASAHERRTSATLISRFRQQLGC